MFVDLPHGLVGVRRDYSSRDGSGGLQVLHQRYVALKVFRNCIMIVRMRKPVNCERGR